MTPAIKIENLSKQYRLGLVGTGTLSHDLNRWWHNFRGKEDPYLKIGETNDRSTKGLSDYVWALKDINFAVQQGDVLGIIGKNGAGKSTLLKILSKVTAPTTGAITYQGRIASLLEVGTGFHPEQTGRENIYLNGAILGMRKQEINRKFDEIVDFSGCERYIDTPVKRYSSGMTVRLGFAVAAFLEPEILIVDEVLAVGDAEFQKKAIGKMKDVSKNDGRTVLFVSHNMSAVKSLCSTVIILNNGTILSHGKTDNQIEEYLSVTATKRNFVHYTKNKPGNEICNLISARVINKKNELAEVLFLDEEIKIETSYTILVPVEGVSNINIYNAEGNHVFFSSENQKKYSVGNYCSAVTIPGNLLNVGIYYISLYFTSLIPYKIHYQVFEELCFEIIEDNNKRIIEFSGKIPGLIRPELKWETNKLL